MHSNDLAEIKKCKRKFNNVLTSIHRRFKMQPRNRLRLRIRKPQGKGCNDKSDEKVVDAEVVDVDEEK